MSIQICTAKDYLEFEVSENTCEGWPQNFDKNSSEWETAEDEFQAKKVKSCSLPFSFCLLLQCVTGVFDFPSALLFSVETMTTIG